MLLTILSVASILTVGRSSAQETVNVLRTQLSLSGDDSAIGSGYAYLNLTGENRKEITLCLRHRVKTVGNSHYDEIISIKDVPSFEGDYKWRKSKFSFAYSVIKTANYLSMVTTGETSDYRSFFFEGEKLFWLVPNLWRHVCMSFGESTKQLVFVLDGNIQEPRNNHVFDSITEQAVVQILLRAGEFSDFNVWNSIRSNDFMQKWTTCKSKEKGDLINWDSFKWTMENMEESEMDYKSICKKAPTNVLLPQSMSVYDGMDQCRKFGGGMTVCSGKQMELDLIADEYYQKLVYSRKDELFALGDTFDFWTGWWDEPQEGQFSNVNNGEFMSQEMRNTIFIKGQPNGATIENCVQVWPGKAGWLDAQCRYKKWVFCYLPEIPVFAARGMPDESAFDTQYSADSGDVAGGLFTGFTGSWIGQDNVTKIWRMGLVTNPGLIATLDEKPLVPIGTYTFNLPEVDTDKIAKVPINLNTCDDATEFNCGDGTCIKIEDRCNGNGEFHCPDQSDEMDCRIIYVDDSYLPYYPCPPLEKEDNALAVIYFDLAVISVHDIKEVQSLMTLQFELSLKWRDPRVTFLNLKQQEFLNRLGPNDVSQIWTPQVVFYNTVNKDQTLVDDKSQEIVLRKGKFSPSPTNRLHNDHLYQGSENDIVTTRIYSQDFICDFELSYYPFDVQLCKMVFTLKGTTGNFAKLVEERINYLGNVGLIQYGVDEVLSNYTTTPDGNDGIEVTIVLSRQLLYQLMTAFVPCVVICVASFTTSFYDPAFFEAIVAVNLTSMLCIVTLFTSISEKIPKTAYLKLIDAWFIICMAVPFAEVIIHTVIDVLRHKTEDLENDEKVWTRIRGTNSESGGVHLHKMQGLGKDKVDVIKTRFMYVLTFARWGLPAVYASAVIAIAISGMSNIYI